MGDVAATEALRIGEVAALVGCATSTVRYYERAGVLSAPARVSGQRRYTMAEVGRLRLVLVLRSAGLTMRDLALVLDHSDASAALRRATARQRAEELRVQIQQSARALAILEHGAGCTAQSLDDAECAADIERRLVDAGLYRGSWSNDPSGAHV